MTERILDAALQHLLDFGVRNLSVDAVARLVGIARVTIYRRFASKDDLLRAVIVREGSGVLARTDEAVAGIADPDDQLVEGFAVILTEVRSHPLVERTLRTEPDVLAGVVVTHGDAMIALARDYLAARLPRRKDAQRVAELAVRLSLSFLMAPASCIPLADEADARAFGRQYLLPMLRRTP